MRRTRMFAVAVSALWLLASGCGSSAGGGTGGATGTGGASAGTGGASAGTGGASGGFMSVLPCATEAVYATTGTTVTVGANSVAAFDPKCLKVSAGATVTFSGDFTMHPLSPSTMRGTLTGNPITHTGSGTTKSFSFPTPGYYAYFCEVHGPSDGGAGMVGVVWVQ